MDNRDRSAINENIRRLLMFKTLKDIKKIIELEDSENRKTLSLTLKLITGFVIIVCALILISLVLNWNQETNILDSKEPVPEMSNLPSFDYHKGTG